LPSAEEEKAQYLLHENNIDDPRYQNFVRPIFDEVIKRAPRGAKGLDYGCGTGPVLTSMLSQRGFLMTLYDPFFANAPNVLKQTYDFIVCCEVAEHFHQPKVEFAKLFSLLRLGGFLALMTDLRQPDTDFASWHYRRDPTHVAFYSEKSFDWIKSKFGFSAQACDGKRLLVLTK